MRIAWAIPCRYVEVNDGLATIVGGGANIYVLPPDALPAPLSVTIAAQIAGADDEADQPHHLSGQVLGPDMTPVGDPLDLPDLQIPPGLHKPPGWETTIVISIVLHWEVAELGTHTIQLTIDDRSTTVAILVAEEGPPDADGD